MLAQRGAPLADRADLPLEVVFEGLRQVVDHQWAQLVGEVRGHWRP